MVEFESWNDFKLFFEKYVVRSCFNCTGFRYNKEEFKGRFICFKTFSPVRMDMVKICAEWEDNEGHRLDDLDDSDEVYGVNLSPELADKLERMDKIVSFEEIEEIINGHEEVSSEKSAEVKS